MRSRRQADTDQFYRLLAELGRREEGPRRLRDCAGAGPWPRHGVYFFCEDGEDRADSSPRVVRVGTHALTPTSQTTMWAGCGSTEGGSAAATPAAATTGHRSSGRM